MNADLDPRSIDVHGNNAVHQAAANSQIDVLKVFMSAGVDIEQPNDRGHYPIDLATDLDVKSLINRSKKQNKCVGKNCGGSKFTFQNTQFFCTDCNRFFCKKDSIRYKVFESVNSQVPEKAVCRCEECLQRV